MDLGGAAAGGVPCGTLSFFALPAAGGVPCGLSLSGLPAGCSLGGQLLWIWAVLLMVVFRVGHFLSLGFLLLAVFCVDPFSLWASCWLFSWRTTSVDLGGAAAGGVPCGTLSFFGLPAAGCVLCGPFLSGLPVGCSLGGQLLWIWAVLLLVVFRVGHFLWASCCWWCSLWTLSLWASCCWLCSVWASLSLWAP